ncbi:hypothetical protein [uncultured Eubacterium sp.]|uniref:hypothetical protein n=1 Tax=uncultured Eubacterium sp. TaxID=165185 RepID=UPI0025EC01FB|nr:hypothetical protein [uncultured Eubacterium sp.]
MKKNYIAITLGLMLGATAVAGCGTAKTTDTSATEEAQTVYGEITEISEDSITIKVGTQKEAQETKEASVSDNSDDADSTDESAEANSSDSTDGKTDTSDSDSEDSADASANTDSRDAAGSSDSGKQSDNANGTPGEASSMLDDTGEELTVKITDDTEITKDTSHGGMGQSTPPEMPSGEAPGSNSDSNGAPDGQSTPPEKPDGESTDGNSDSNGAPDGQSTPPEKPDGDSTDSNSTSDRDDSESEDIDFDDLAVGDIVEVSYDEDGDVVTVTVLMSENGMGMGQPGGASAGVTSYDALNEYSEDTTVDGETIASTGTDENAIHVTDGAKVSMKNSTITRKSSDSTGGDNSSFYGVGAAVLTTDGTSYISNSTIDTDAAGAAGIFAYGDGVVYASDSSITTAQDTSGGIHVAGGGTLYAWNLTAETNGNSSAAIRSDRGGGTMVVDGGSYTSNGTGSPAIYSTADITVNDAQLTANGSEAICIEGLNSIRLYNCDLTGNMGDDSQNDCTWNVILYQSMSGDSEVGNSTFEMNGGTLTAKNGGMFYTTNTESTITLSDVDITNAEDSEFFLRCTGNNNQRGWGQTGSNGADCLFTAIDQEMSGDVIWDSISQLDFYMTDGSTLTGAILDDETYAGNGGDGYCNLYIEKGSTWVVTGDSTLSTLSNAGTIVDESGNTVTIKGTDGTVYVKGTSSYTITVDSYQTSVDLSGAATTTSWSDYEVAKPAELS